MEATGFIKVLHEVYYHIMADEEKSLELMQATFLDPTKWWPAINGNHTYLIPENSFFRVVELGNVRKSCAREILGALEPVQSGDIREVYSDTKIIVYAISLYDPAPISDNFIANMMAAEAVRVQLERVDIENERRILEHFNNADNWAYSITGDPDTNIPAGSWYLESDWRNGTVDQYLRVLATHPCIIDETVKRVYYSDDGLVYIWTPRPPHRC